MSSPIPIKLEKSETSEWKQKEILESTDETAQELKRKWEIDEKLSKKPIRVNISNRFGAYLDDDSITLSDPDLYRTGMKEKFNDTKVLNLIDGKYPVPFHEVAEEVGQFIGRNIDNSWSYNEDLKGGVKDEMFGLMSLNHFFPDFVEVYKDKFEDNLEAIKEVNSEEQVSLLYDFEEDTSEHDIIEAGYDEIEFEDINYSRGVNGLPTPFSVKAKDVIDDSDRYDLDTLNKEELEEWREIKLFEESKPWIARIVASKVYENLSDSYNDEELIDRSLPSEEMIESKLDSVGVEYGVEYP